MKTILDNMKSIIKILLIVSLIVCYFTNLIFMFVGKPLDLLIGNIIIWAIVIIIPFGFAFVLWLNDWE